MNKIAINKSIKWVSANVLNLNPSIQESSIPKTIKTKAFFELIVILYMVKNLGGTKSNISILSVLYEKVRQIDASLFIDFIFNNRINTIKYFTGLLYWYGLFPNEKIIKDAAEKAYQANLFSSLNLPVLRIFENSVLLDKLGFKSFSNSKQKQMLQYTVLGKKLPDLLSIGRPDEYEFTHMLFYITYFGSKTDLHDLINDGQIQYIKELLLYFISKNIIDSNNDLLAEHVYCYNLIDRSLTTPDLVSDALQKIIRNQNKNGMIEAARNTTDYILYILEKAKCSMEEKEIVINYHATLVFLLAYYSFTNKHYEKKI